MWVTFSDNQLKQKLYRRFVVEIKSHQIYNIQSFKLCKVNF